MSEPITPESRDKAKEAEPVHATTETMGKPSDLQPSQHQQKSNLQMGKKVPLGVKSQETALVAPFSDETISSVTARKGSSSSTDPALEKKTIPAQVKKNAESSIKIAVPDIAFPQKSSSRKSSGGFSSPTVVKTPDDDTPPHSSSLFSESGTAFTNTLLDPPGPSNIAPPEASFAAKGMSIKHDNAPRTLTLRR